MALMRVRDQGDDSAVGRPGNPRPHETATAFPLNSLTTRSTALTSARLLALQRTVGNRAVCGALQRDGGGPIPNDYSHLAVTSAGATISNSGEFLGASAKEYAAAKKRLRKAHLSHDEADIRFEMLRPKIDESWTRLKDEVQRRLTFQAAGGARPRALGIFTAPEWFFKQPNRPFMSKEKDDIIRRFEQLSKGYPDLLLVPGTIMWEEPSEDDEAVLYNTGFAVLNGNLLKMVNKSENAGDTEGYYERKDDKRTRGLPSKSEANAAYARGAGVREQHLGATTGSVAGDSSHFDVGGLRVALEICGDHANIARAKSDVKVGAGPPSGVDLQILIAHGGQYARGSDVTRPGGLFVFNDAGDSKSAGERKVWKNTTATMGGAITSLGQGAGVGQDAPSIVDFHVGATALPARTPQARRAQLVATLTQAVAALKSTRGMYHNWTTVFDVEIAKLKNDIEAASEAGDKKLEASLAGQLRDKEENKQAGIDVVGWIDDVIGPMDALVAGLGALPPTVTAADAGRDAADALGEVVEGLDALPASSRDNKIATYDMWAALFTDLVALGV